MEEKNYSVLARVLWFNDAKGYGLVRAENVDLEDIRVDAGILEGFESGLLRDMLVNVTYIEDLTGLVARKVVFAKKVA